MQELADAPLIGLSSADPLYALLDNSLKTIEPPPRINIAVQTYSLARAMVESGAGLAIIDPFTALDASPASTLIRPLSPALPITLYALTRTDEAPAHMLEGLLHLFAEHASEQLQRIEGG